MGPVRAHQHHAGTRANPKWGSNNFNARGSWMISSVATASTARAAAALATDQRHLLEQHQLTFIQPNTTSCKERGRPGAARPPSPPRSIQASARAQQRANRAWPPPGLLVPNSAVPNYLYGSRKASALVNWDKFAKDTKQPPALPRQHHNRTSAMAPGGYARDRDGFYTG